MSWAIMEISHPDDEGDPPLLIDSGTESYTESPTEEESDKPMLSSCQPEDSTILCDIVSDVRMHKSLTLSSRSLMDKDISVDEDTLDTPLEPTKYHGNIIHSSNTEETHINLVTNTAISELKFLNDFTENENLLVSDDEDHSDIDKSDSELINKNITSILRRHSYSNQEQMESCIEPSTIPRKVSFPCDELLVTYREPEFSECWKIKKYMSSKEILQAYENSCKRHKTIQLDTIKCQLNDVKNNQNRTAMLNLSSMVVSRDVCETLEDLFKIVNFRTITIKECEFTQETTREFLNMLEYYDSVAELVISQHFDDTEWRNLCSILGKSSYLECITFKEMNITDPCMRVFINQVKKNPKITTIRFDSCGPGQLPTSQLIEGLMLNTSLRELYLPQTGLYTKEADSLRKFLSKNSHLQVLDISNNLIGDRGLEVLANGLTNQNSDGQGLSVLIIFNNQLTEKSAPTLCNILSECKNLHTLNVGYNNLTDNVIPKLKEGLLATTSLEGLGLQSTLLTCAGVKLLAEAIEGNKTLHKINLKGNKGISNDGLESLSQALTKSKIMKVELDESNRSCSDPTRYAELVQTINGICTVNKSLAEQPMEEHMNLSQQISRKVSLSCEPRFFTPPILLDNSTNSTRIKSPNPSPMPSPGCSPAPRSRFQVSRVPDKLPSSPINSRFKVFAVTSPLSETGGGDCASVKNSSPPDDDDVVENRFSNVRSSVSSIDSVESLTPPKDNFITNSPTSSGESE